MQPRIQHFQLTDEATNLDISPISSNYTASIEDDVLLCTGSITITLPELSTVSSGFYIHVKNNGTDTVTIQPFGNETIDGATLAEISTQYNSFYLTTDGTNWFII